MKARMDVAVRGLFATPVAALEVPEAEARNAELTTAILKRRSETPSIQASNAGGWHSDREILDWGGQHVGHILDLAKEMANRLTADRNGKPVRPGLDRHGMGQRRQPVQATPTSATTIPGHSGQRALLCCRWRLRHRS